MHQHVLSSVQHGLHQLSRLHRHDSSIRVLNKAWVTWQTVWEAGDGVSNVNSSSCVEWIKTLGSKVSNLSSKDLWSLGYALNAIRIGHNFCTGNSSGSKESSEELHVW